MKKTLITAALTLALASAGQAMAAGSMAHTHIGHVTSGWADTPGKAGLMPTALDEARVALQHANLAAKKLDDLKWMQTHTGHVMHAIDPSTTKGGPGKGYGVIRAAQGVAKHINAAAASDDASGAVKTHAVHIAASANNAVDRGQQILKLAAQVMDAQDAATAAAAVSRIQELAGQILDGIDANGDGTITWEPGEGGLNESAKHAGILSKTEGLATM